MKWVDTCRVTTGQRSRLTEAYTALHEGLPPKEFICEPWTKPTIVRVLGRATEIQYRKKVPDGTPSYHHPWAEQARPTIGVDSQGHLQFKAGRYETTRRGIEDRILAGTDSPETYEYLRRPIVQKERWVPAPRSLNTLGRLEFVRYNYLDNGQWRERDLRFPLDKAPVIAHDQAGNLHALRGRYQISERGVEPQMAFPIRRFHYDDNPKRRSHYGHRSHRRRNPSSAAAGSPARMSGGQRASRMILDTAIKGSVGFGEILLVGYGLRKIAPTMGAPARILTKFAVGLGGGLGLAYAAPKMPHLASGFAIGGVIDGLMDVWNVYLAPRLSSMMTTAPAPQVQAPTSTPPAGQAFLPGGLPRQYAGYSPAACGVA